MTAPVLGTETWPTYLDLEQQVIPWLRFKGIPVSTETQFVLQLITDSVCTEAQRFIDGPIAASVYGPSTGIGKFDGSGGMLSGYILLPRTPVISVTEVIEYQGSTPVTLHEVDPSTGKETVATGFQVEYRTGRLTRVLGRIWNRPFYPGSNNVWVTWTAGYNPIPTDIIRASLEWVAHVYRNTQQVVGGGLRPTSPNDEYEAATVSEGLWVGVPNRVVNTLKSYVAPVVR